MGKIDMTGRVFGEWTVLRESPNSKKNARWVCQCSCGAEHSVPGNSLRNGTTGQCRACWVKKNSGPKEDLTGRVFGKWTVLSAAGRTSGILTWMCQCECGTIKDVRSDALRNGTSTQCRGCANRARKH